jgi:hypothetical protein
MIWPLNHTYLGEKEMQISKSFKELIAEEIDFAVNKMKETKDPLQVLYYFSAIPGMFHRIFNMEYDPDLIFAHHVLLSTQEAFNARLKAIKSGDGTLMLDDSQFETLIDMSQELSIKIKKDKEIDSILKKFTILLYSTTGNGYYLMQKGLLKI